MYITTKGGNMKFTKTIDLTNDSTSDLQAAQKEIIKDIANNRVHGTRLDAAKNLVSVIDNEILRRIFA